MYYIVGQESVMLYPDAGIQVVDMDDYKADSIRWRDIEDYVKSGVLVIENIQFINGKYYVLEPNMFYGYGIFVVEDELLIIKKEDLLCVWYNNYLYDIKKVSNCAGKSYAFKHTKGYWVVRLGLFLLFLDKDRVIDTCNASEYTRYKLSSNDLIKRMLLGDSFNRKELNKVIKGVH